MASQKASVDLEKELSCSICTELLYRPLTVLDCLHTFCGACVKEWFGWQATAAENAPTPPAPDAVVFTCPACRTPVRDTKHNATVTTLLDMLLTAQPDKNRSETDKADMDAKYQPGDQVMPKLRFRDRTPNQRRQDDAERRLLADVQAMSLRDAVASPSQPRVSRSDGSAPRPSRRSTDSHRRDGGSRTRDGSARRGTEDETRRRPEPSDTLQPQAAQGERHHHRSGSGRRSRETSEARQQRQIEHQPSLRSLIGSSYTGSLDIEREIEEFARQIQEEGLLEGLDLDNVDPSNNDELSRRITEAYRRRQRERSRHDGTRRSNASAASHNAEAGQPMELRPRAATASRPASRQRSNSQTQAPSHSRSPSATRPSEDRSRPPISNPSLEVREEPRRHRRRTTSEGRSATLPLGSTQPPARVNARSQTDLSRSPSHSERVAAQAPIPLERPTVSDGRSTSSPVVTTSAQMEPSMRSQPATPRSAAAGTPPVATVPTFEPRARQAGRPQETFLPARANFALSSVRYDDLATSPATSPAGHQRTGSQYYKEPSITCSRCFREHIEYEVHYNCSQCNRGTWNICLDCYRGAKGCLHWFGFGDAAWQKWENRRRAGEADLAPPHMLTAGRYLPPRPSEGGADGRRVLTTENPWDRLQTGTFCMRCFAWTNDCYWRCESCNDGDWGFCNDCVNQGRCCTHPLLPLAYEPRAQTNTPPASPRSPGRPPSASLSTAVDAAAIGSFKPLNFSTLCDVCRTTIPATQNRHHCYSCVSSVTPNSRPGDYDICQPCYAQLVDNGDFSAENGPAGWRRCPQGHRMVVVGFQGGRGGQRRQILQDMVGGRALQIEPAGSDADPGLQRWYIGIQADRRLYERLVTRDVRATAVAPHNSATFPPDGGLGASGVAHWAWYPTPGADDELLFPRLAEVREIEDVNGEWFHGVFMGAKGLFPAGYVRDVVGLGESG